MFWKNKGAANLPHSVFEQRVQRHGVFRFAPAEDTPENFVLVVSQCSFVL